MAPLDSGQLHATAFHASSHDNDQCGSNGLPLTPNSIRMFGRFQYLTLLEHANLCSYIEMQRGKHEQVMVVSAGHKDTLISKLAESLDCRLQAAKRLSYEMLCALSYLHSRKVTHRNLSLRNVLLDSYGTVKLSNFGLYYMTENGATVSFPIGDYNSMAPEVFLLDLQLLAEEGTTKRRTLSTSDATEMVNPSSPPNVDTWSLGVVLLQYLAGEELWKDLPVTDVIHSRIELLSAGVECAFDQLVQGLAPQAQQNILSADNDLMNLVKECLLVNPTKRPAAATLLSHPLFAVAPLPVLSTIPTYKPMRLDDGLRCKDLTIQQIHHFTEELVEDDYFHLKERSFSEIYYLWKLAGGDLESVLKANGLITNTPPIINMYSYVSEEGDAYGATHDLSTMYSDRAVVLDLTQLCERLSEVNPEDYYPLIISEERHAVNSSVTETAKLPLVIRERDVEYQFHRVVLFERLLTGYPHTKNMIMKESRTDIPPLVRPAAWAAILDVQGDIYKQYDRIDKVSAQPIDRQIEVDVPRCHQYNELMSSPEAHRKLKRVLKAWVTSHPQYVYWQGLDSLSAPFIYLNFNDEAMAYACLSKFISKYLYNFFLKDNSAVIQEYLAMFSQLLAFHEPELSNHLEEDGFSPDLYAIPWFLTMYAHVFPLHRLFHLWDTLLLGASVFPLCIGIAILQQLKSRLLTYGFNECILLFSDLPEINIEQCVTDSVKIFCSTPKSSTARVHAPPSAKPVSEGHKSSHEKGLAAEPLQLSELKGQRCLKISADEMLTILTPTADWRPGKPKLIVIDIRSTDEYQKGTIPDSLHSPCETSFSKDGHICSPNLKDFLDDHKYQVKVVVDSNNTHSGEFAAKLVALGYSKVCYLHKGLSVLRGSNLLVVPSPNM